MNLEIFNTENAVSFGRMGKPTITFAETGQIRLSKHLISKLEAKAGMFVEFSRDKDAPEDWYFKLSESGNGFPLKDYKQDGSLNLNSKVICESLFNEFKTTKTSLSIPVSTTPDDNGWFAILTVSINK